MMEKTFVKKVKYRDVSFTWKTIKSQWQNYSFFILDKFDFFYVETATKDTPYKLRHWYIWWFTQNKRRKIKMSFSAFAYTELERRNLIKQVNQLFSPPNNPNFTDNKWYYPIEFTTIDWITRQAKAKVISRPKDKELWNIHVIWFEVDLIVENSSCIYSKELYTLNDRNYIKWTSLWASLWFSFSDYPTTATNTITYNWISKADVKCTITALQNNATIWNIQIMSIRNDNYSRMFFNVDLNLWDVLIIDPYNNIVELNWNDITGDLELSFWNNYPKLIPNDNPQKLIVDTWKPTKTCDVKREYRETRC